MKYCCSSYVNANYQKMCAEIRYHSNSLNAAIETAINYPNKKIIVLFENLDIPIEKMFSLQTETPNLLYEFKELSKLINYSKYCKEHNGLPSHQFMFGQPVVTWALVMILRYYKVSDILIAEPLTFNMETVDKGIREEGIRVRVCPTNTRNDFAVENDEDYAINHFFILPQAVSLYEYHIDVIDLDENFFQNNVIRQEALIRLYVQEKDYQEDLSFLLNNFNGQCSAKMLDEDFFYRRMNCGQTCLISNNKCHYCSTLQKFEKLLIQKNTL